MSLSPRSTKLNNSNSNSVTSSGININLNRSLENLHNSTSSSSPGSTIYSDSLLHSSNSNLDSSRIRSRSITFPNLVGRGSPKKEKDIQLLRTPPDCVDDSHVIIKGNFILIQIIISIK
jgi:hypothetical protein